MVALIIGALVLVLVILMAYQRYVARKKPVQHLCDYCGHMANAKATVGAISAQVFEALTNAAQLAAWWAEDVRVDAQMSGVYEGTLPTGRVEGTITWIEGPRKLSFEWPIFDEGMSVVTSVVYELSPKGPQTVVHVSHRSPKPVPGDWTAVWTRAIESLKAYLEAAPPTASTTMDSP